jgi:hypothetical protein
MRAMALLEPRRGAQPPDRQEGRLRLTDATSDPSATLIALPLKSGHRTAARPVAAASSPAPLPLRLLPALMRVLGAAVPRGRPTRRPQTGAPQRAL